MSVCTPAALMSRRTAIHRRSYSPIENAFTTASRELAQSFAYNSRGVARGSAPAIGFLGLGGVGAPIVGRLLDAGHEVTGWNRSEAKAAPLRAAGMGWAASPKEVAAGSDVMISILT